MAATGGSAGSPSPPKDRETRDRCESRWPLPAGEALFELKQFLTIATHEKLGVVHCRVTPGRTTPFTPTKLPLANCPLLGAFLLPEYGLF